MASITIRSPSDNGTVSRPFTASGIYVSSDPGVLITVVLKDSAGAIVATGFPVTADSGNWSAPLNPMQGYSGATVEATLDTVSDSVTNITVT